MNRFYRYFFYIIFCLVVMVLPSIKNECLDWSIWLYETINHDYFIASLCLAILFFSVDILFCTYKSKKAIDIKVYKTNINPFYFDLPNSDDKFNRSSYAKLLLDKIYSSFYNNNSQGKKAKHSFVIHIGEHYGQGKTSFLMMLENEAKKCMDKKPAVYINFEPWLCDTETGIITEFFSIFRENLKEMLPELDKTVRDYATLLLSSVGYSSSGFSIDFASLGMKNEGSLKSNHDRIREELQKINRPIIITIDDVDRLQSKELMMVLKLIRDTADFPNVFYIVAADNIHLKKMLNIQHIDDAETYLEKFFNLEFLLPANENIAFNELIKNLRAKFEVLQIQNTENCLQKIINVPHIKDVFLNMRDVYRFLNTYFLAIDSMNDVKEIDIFDLFLLTVIQIEDMEYYVQLRDNSLNILNVVRYRNDIILTWKENLNVVKARNDQDIKKHLKRIEVEKSGVESQKNEEEKEQSIAEFRETKEWTKITADKIVPEIMNLLFGYSSNSVIGENQACRYNMYYKYFANTDASYMVSRMEIVSMLDADESTYERDLDYIFRQGRDYMFLAEFTNAIPYTNNIQDITILRRFFIFIEFSYKYKREITIPDIIKSLADYEGHNNIIEKLFIVLSFVYGSTRIDRTTEIGIKKRTEFLDYCKTYNDINILLVCFNIISNRLSSFIFDRNEIKTANKILVDRFFNEHIANSSGNIDVQEADTIIQIKCNSDALMQWENLFEKYLEDNKEACLNILCKLVQFYPKEIGWNHSIHEALMGKYYLPKDNMLSRLAEKHTDLKDILNEIIFLHNSNTQTLSKDYALVKMAKERQQK